MATFVRRRIIFVSVAVARFLLLAEARVVRSSELLEFENCKQVLNLSSCRDKDGCIEGTPHSEILVACTYRQSGSQACSTTLKRKA